MLAGIRLPGDSRVLALTTADEYVSRHTDVRGRAPWYPATVPSSSPPGDGLLLPQALRYGAAPGVLSIYLETPPRSYHGWTGGNVSDNL